MKIKYQNKPDKLYINIFISLLLAIFITIIILSTMLHINFEKIVLSQNYSLYMDKLSQTSQSTDFMRNTANSLSRQVYYDAYIQKLFLYSSPNIEEINTAINQLETYRTTTPFIDSIYVYNKVTGKFYTSSYMADYTANDKKDFSDKEVVEIIETNSFKRLTPITRIIPRNYSDVSFNKQSEVYSFFYNEDINDKGDFNSLVVVNISKDWMQNIIGKVDDNLKNSTIIIDKNNRVVFNNDKKYSTLEDISKEKFISKISNFGSSSGYFIEKINGVESLIVFTRPDAVGWRYINIVPYKQITAQISKMRDKTFIVGLLILVIGLMFSYLMSKRYYATIDFILLNLKRLEDEKRDNFFVLKQEFLRNAFLEWNNHELNKIEDKFSRFNIKMSANDSYCMVLIKIDDYFSFLNKYTAEEKKLLKFGIMNICAEIVKPTFTNEVVDMNEDNITLLLDVTGIEKNKLYNDLKTLCESVQIRVEEIYNITLSFAISTIKDTMNCFPVLYNEVCDTIFHRIFYGKKSLIYSEDLQLLKLKTYVYPLSTEKSLINALMLGNIEEVKKLYLEIIDYISGFPSITVNLAFSHLLFNVSLAFETIQKNNFGNEDFSFNISAFSLYKVESISQINNEFFKILQNLADRLNEKKNNRQDDLLDKINEIIRQNYMNPNLSLDYIANLINLSPTYISRLFKKATNSTILDNITEMRMNKARELLLSTNKSVSEISEETGFVNSPYFYKVFKKLNGITPNEYRKNPTNNNE